MTVRHFRSNTLRAASALLVALMLGGGLSACAPIVVGGAAVGSVLIATDRRTSGAQIDDEGIELKAASRINDAFGDRIRVNVTSYNRRVLLIGDVPSEKVREQVVKIVSQIDNVQQIVDELLLQISPSLTQRAADSLITGRVKASMVDASDIYANAFKVVTERGTTYLMGRVTQREADRATEISRATPGVMRVVRVLEIISEEELQQLLPQKPKK